MKYFVSLLILGWALFNSPIQSKAEPYTLTDAWTSRNQGATPWSRSPKRPLVVDLVGHTLTVPTQVVGYTLMLENEEGEVYTYYINGTTLEFPYEFSGVYCLTIFDDSFMYKGAISLPGENI